MPVRIQRRRTKGWRKPEGSIYVGRPSRWGNPFNWRDYPDREWGLYQIPDFERRQNAADDFRAALDRGDLEGYPSVEEIRAELAGRDLVCWCPPDDSCHADVLLELANPKES